MLIKLDNNSTKKTSRSLVPKYGPDLIYSAAIWVQGSQGTNREFTTHDVVTDYT